MAIHSYKSKNGTHFIVHGTGMSIGHLNEGFECHSCGEGAHWHGPPGLGATNLPATSVEDYENYGVESFCGDCVPEDWVEAWNEAKGGTISKKELRKMGTKKNLEWHELVDMMAEHANRVLLHGPPGTGKTTRCFKWAEKTGRPLYSITGTEETPVAELIGHYVPKGGEFVWKDGIAVRAMKEGALFVVNEIDRLGGAASTICHNLLDDPSVLVLDLPNGERVKPHANFRVWATTNQEPDALDEALRDRFVVRIKCDSPAPEALDKLSPEVAKTVSNSYASLKRGSTFANTTFVSTRQGIEFDTLRKQVKNEDAVAQAIWGPHSKQVLEAIRLNK